MEAGNLRIQRISTHQLKIPLNDSPHLSGYRTPVCSVMQTLNRTSTGGSLPVTIPKPIRACIGRAHPTIR